MEDLTSYVKENDTDKIELDKLKELVNILTGGYGQSSDDIPGEAIADVIGFICDANNVEGSNKKYFQINNGDEVEFDFLYPTIHFTCIPEVISATGKSYTGICEEFATYRRNINSDSVLEDGTIEMGELIADSDVEVVNGLIPCVFTLNDKETYYNGSIIIKRNKVYLLMNDTSILTSSNITLNVSVASGIVSYSIRLDR